MIAYTMIKSMANPTWRLPAFSTFLGGGENLFSIWGTLLAFLLLRNLFIFFRCWRNRHMAAASIWFNKVSVVDASGDTRRNVFIGYILGHPSVAMLPKERQDLSSPAFFLLLSFYSLINIPTAVFFNFPLLYRDGSPWHSARPNNGCGWRKQAAGGNPQNTSNGPR